MEKEDKSTTVSQSSSRSGPLPDLAGGYSAEAYTQREKGYSPNHIRDAVAELCLQQVSGTVLDAGSGSGGWIERLKETENTKKIVSVDIVDDGASRIAGVEFHLVDLSRDRLPCGDSELDWMFALEVLEHLANPRHFIAESYRCLKSGGRLVVTTPCNESLRAKLSFALRGYFPSFCESVYRHSGHITPICEIDLQRMSAESGFQSPQFFYPLRGLIPGLKLHWQTLFPWLSGKAWSDTLIAAIEK